MNRMADILVTSADDQPQLAVEVKNKVGATPEWAAQLRRNRSAHSALPNTPFFMLAALDRFFLWKQRAADIDAPPDYVVDAGELLKPYSDIVARGGRSPSAYALELMVGAWLSDLIRREPRESDKRLSWLFDSGLYRAIRNGGVRTQAPV